MIDCRVSPKHKIIRPASITRHEEDESKTVYILVKPAALTTTKWRSLVQYLPFYGSNMRHGQQSRLPSNQDFFFHLFTQRVVSDLTRKSLLRLKEAFFCYAIAGVINKYCELYIYTYIHAYILRTYIHIAYSATHRCKLYIYKGVETQTATQKQTFRHYL